MMPNDAAERKREFLRRLPHEDFVPPEEACADLNAAAGMALPITPEAAAAETARQRDAVEAFATEYWSLAPAERRARWQSLSDARPAWPVSARLAELGFGLDLEVTPDPDPAADELAALIRELSVLRPAARSVRRAEWLSENIGRLPALGAAAQRLAATTPVMQELEPALFDFLLPGNGPLVPLAPVSAVSIAPNPYNAAPDAHRPNAAPSEQRWPVWLAIGIALLALRACFGGSNVTRETVPQPRYQIDGLKIPIGAKRISVTEYLEYLKYEDELRRRRISTAPTLDKGPLVPRGYTNWVNNGRPGPDLFGSAP